MGGGRPPALLTLALPSWPGHRPGQHVDLRLTAEDGYSVERSYSIASEPGRRGEIDITVERIADGEVSPFLDDVVIVGDRLELRGPIGGYFVWEAALGGPLLLVAGGSGVVPLMAMIRHRQRAGSSVPARLLLSSRGAEEIIYRDELDRLAGANDGFDVVHTLTRSQPVGWHADPDGYPRCVGGVAGCRQQFGPASTASRAWRASVSAGTKMPMTSSPTNLSGGSVRIR